MFRVVSVTDQEIGGVDVGSLSVFLYQQLDLDVLSISGVWDHEEKNYGPEIVAEELVETYRFQPNCLVEIYPAEDPYKREPDHLYLAVVKTVPRGAIHPC